jgi:hypothetical protein
MVARTVFSIVVYADGLCEPRNPEGYSCWGWLGIDADGKRLAWIIHEGSEHTGARGMV